MHTEIRSPVTGSASGSRTKGGVGVDGVVRGIDRASNAALHVATALLFVIVALSCANVVGRYVFGAPISWADEAVMFLMIWMVFLGAVAVAWNDQHIKVEVLVGMASPRWQVVIRTIVDLVVAAVALLLCQAGGGLIWKLLKFDQRSDALEIPLYIPQAAIPVGMGVIGLFVLVRLVLRVRAARRATFAGDAT